MGQSGRKHSETQIGFFFCQLTYFFYFFLISWRLITLQYCSGFYHTLT